MTRTAAEPKAQEAALTRSANGHFEELPSEFLPDRSWTEYDVAVRYGEAEQPRSERFVLFIGGDFDARPVAQGGDVLWG
ncbi:hypothetical protein [Teichococcus vastitatis]|uniref:Uncharacterized protein n=1 Tax=Teichococcus vastitatis TaxID=2307076 RepID=A0ABS9W861_9PROT|nr:hypothetical protein [Pseudoroseomonas vastitatis]MCI0755482.1 hypothetical protein [Pseudoroseomonas vastitatis]